MVKGGSHSALPSPSPATRAEATLRDLPFVMLLTHFYPECEGEDILGQCRKCYAGEILLAEDLLRVSV